MASLEGRRRQHVTRILRGSRQCRSHLRMTRQSLALDNFPFADYIPNVLFVRGASRGVEQAEQDAAPARVVRDHVSGRRKATDRANYVALPLVAARGAAERREIRRDERTSERCSDPAPGRAVPSPKIPHWSAERRCAVWVWLSQAANGERDVTIAPFGAPCPSFYLGRN
jgi:hypothetical protein